MNFIELVKNPWPWYVAGPLIGLIVPTLLILGNKTFGISSSLRHVCAACIPMNISFFKYNWKKEIWNLLFVLGITLGGFITVKYLSDSSSVLISNQTVLDLKELGIVDFSGLLPADIFSFENLFSLKGLWFSVLGGFLVGFGTRYAGGCTSGHSIMGLANLQWPSLVATCCFMIGGILTSYFLIPLLLK